VLDVLRSRLPGPERWIRNVDPPQALLDRTPERAFAENIAAINDARRLHDYDGIG
jgi:hypothetical protein